MGRALTIRKPTAAELRQLHTWLEGPLNVRQFRRAEALFLYATDMTAVEIAHALERHRNTIYADLHAFELHGLTAIHHLRSRGAPMRISAAQVGEILRIAERLPYELGLPYGRWSAAKLREYLLKQRIVKALSREHLRRILKKGAQFSPGPAQAPQPGPSPASHFGAPALDLAPAAAPGGLAVL